MPTKIQGGLGIDKVQDGTVGMSDVDPELYGRFFGNLNFQSYMYVRDEKPSGTSGGASSASSWNNRVLNTAKTNTIVGASLNNNNIVLPAGKYYIKATCPVYNPTRSRLRLMNSISEILLISQNAYINSAYNGMGIVHISGVIDIYDNDYIYISTYSQNSATDGLGVSSNISGIVEVYSEVEIWKIG